MDNFTMNTPAPIELSVTAGVPASEIQYLIDAGVCESLTPSGGFVYPERIDQEMIDNVPIVKMALGRVLADKTFGDQDYFRIAMDYMMSGDAALVRVTSRHMSMLDELAHTESDLPDNVQRAPSHVQ